jgi:hypothetical protein
MNTGPNIINIIVCLISNIASHNPGPSQNTASKMVPIVHSIGDLHTLCDVYDIDESFDGGFAFKRSTFSFVDSDDIAYYGQAPIKRTSLSIDDVNNHLNRIPDENIYPEAPSWVTVASNLDISRCYIKRPKLTNFKPEDAGLVHKILLDEAEVFEFLSQHPHPNLVRYHGCLAKRGRIMGLVLDRFSTTLEMRVKKGNVRRFNIECWMAGVESAMKHLHALDMAHNDLNPTNIMLDEHDEAIIIDLGSCKRIGEKLLTGGTPGWVDDFYDTSEKGHDEAALKKIQAWLQDDGLRD